MVKYKKDLDTTCTFCNIYSESISHLFWSCEHTRHFWQGICRFILDNIYDKLELYFKDVLFGITKYKKELSEHFFLCNLLLLLAKFYIHKYKVIVNKPSCISFLKEATTYFPTLLSSNNKKAAKTMTLCSKFKVFI